MERMISSANFMHTDQDDYQQDFGRALDDWVENNGQSLSTAQVLKIFKVTQEKICRPDFPPDGSSGYDMGFHIFGCFKYLVRDMIDEERSRPAELYEGYLELTMRMINAGPLSSHVEYIKILLEDSDFEEYFRAIRGDKLRKIVRALKKEYRGDPSMEWGKYGSSYFESFIRDFVSDGFSEEQAQEAHFEFVELFMFFNHGFANRDEQMRKVMREAAYLIELMFDRKIFQGLSEDNLKHWFVRLSEMILAPEFPQSEDVAKEAEDNLQDILRIVSEEGLIGSMYDVIMDLALNLTIQKAGCEGTKKHFEVIGYFFYHIKEDGVTHNGKLFEGLMQKYIYFLDHVKDEEYLTHRFVRAVMYDCLNKAMSTSDSHVRQWIQMIKTLLKHSVPDCVETANTAMREKDKLIKWKKFPDDIKEIFAVMSNITFPKWLTKEQLEKGMKELEYFSGLILEEAKKAGMAKLELMRPMMEFVFHCVEMRTEAWYSLADSVSRFVEYQAKRDKELIMDTIQRVTAVIEDDSYDVDDEESRDLCSAVNELISHCLESVKDGKYFTWDEYDELIYLAKICQEKMDTASEPSSSVYFNIYVIISFKITDWLQTMNESHRLIPLIPGLILMLESEDESVESIAHTQMAVISRTSGYMFARCLDRLIVIFLDKLESEVLMTIWYSYEFNPGAMEKHFDALYEHVDSGNSSIRAYMLQVLQKVAKHQPQLFDEDKVGVLVKEAKEDQSQQVQILMIINDIAKRHTDVIEPHIKQFMTPGGWDTMSAYHVTNILQLYALGSEEKAETVIQYLLKRMKTATDHNEILFALNACRLIGFKHRPAMEKHRGDIEKFKESTSDNDFHNGCTSILDMLDGKSLDKVANELKELQGDVAELDQRVTVTEKDIADAMDTMQRQGEDLDNVRNDLSEQGQRLDQVKETVDSTVAKVQEIDGKTLSHAPYWARDVSRLLNVEADNDWRLLSLRLGYTNDDIRAWAQQADPCMAMLNEWYTTHKTREATHAVLTSLQLLDREDAAVIVENAMKNAEAVVEDEEFEYATPPDIFLSYQWGHQNEVRLLRQHLEMAGFSCWMDVGQMGGGDKLFEKIDTGIRGAKIVLSCVTGKYAKSPNCNREVNLTVNLGKPMIPLLMEKTSWPPPGSMGPIFSEYLFIRFFQRNGEETTDQRYWPLPKFQELLMQLSVIGLQPNQQEVQPEYKNWWLPPVEEITIDKDRAKKQQTTASSAPAVTDEKAAVSPDVFISYQWGKQPQILKLYKRLTSLGYTCWLDIMQMGGGDSLYDKIDRGLRGCRVVLSCITTKYSKSANCRREVSLADAVQKPLVPLLLEKLSWPPPGPMSPILTQLLYIDCTKDNMEENWAGPKFDEIIAVINQNVPRPRTEGGSAKSSEGKPEVAPPPPADLGERKAGDGAGHVKKVPSEKNKSAPRTGIAPAPAAQAPSDNAGKNHSNNESSETDSRPTQKAYDDESSRTRAEQKPDAQPAYGRKQSRAESMDSHLGHDGHNTGEQQFLRSQGRQVDANVSNCCVIA